MKCDICGKKYLIKNCPCVVCGKNGKCPECQMNLLAVVGQIKNNTIFKKGAD